MRQMERSLPCPPEAHDSSGEKTLSRKRSFIQQFFTEHMPGSVPGPGNAVANETMLLEKLLETFSLEQLRPTEI